MDTLTAIFGNEVKVRVLRLFLFNETVVFLVKEIIEKTKSQQNLVKKELSILEKAEVIKARKVSKEIQVTKASRTK
jgi:transcription initiation factor IIE alpha subunit